MWSFIFKRKNKDRIESSNVMSIQKGTKESEIERISTILKEVLCETSKEIVFYVLEQIGPQVMHLGHWWGAC